MQHNDLEQRTFVPGMNALVVFCSMNAVVVDERELVHACSFVNAVVVAAHVFCVCSIGAVVVMVREAARCHVPAWGNAHHRLLILMCASKGAVVDVRERSSFVPNEQKTLTSAQNLRLAVFGASRPNGEGLRRLGR